VGLAGLQEQYLGNIPFPTLDALETYAESTYSSLHYLILESLGHRSTTLDHIASHLGKSAGISAILRGLPILASSSSPSSSSIVLPLDICAAHNLRQEDVLRQGGTAPGLKNAVFEVATRANDHLITARKMLAEAGKEGKGMEFAAFMSAVPTGIYLERLEKVDFDPFDIKLQKATWNLPWRAWRAYSTKGF
jgi:NADH dehydrogenase [ubiquinone] 1 alpha subcomplex assembly factor 6